MPGGDRFGKTQMKLYVVSDLHIEFGPFDPPPTSADVVVLAGDTHLGVKGITWALEHFSAQVIYIAGNHEYYKQHLGRNLQRMRDAAKGRVESWRLAGAASGPFDARIYRDL